MSTAGLHTHLQSLVAVYHSVVNGFLQQDRPNQLKCIRELFLAFAAAYDKKAALYPTR